MRRISLALALMGAVTAAGCGSGRAPADIRNDPGVDDGTFKVVIQNGQGQTRNSVTGVLPLEMLGGRVTSSPGGINCGAGSLVGCEAEFALGTTVVLTAVPDAVVAPDPAKVLLGWAGECNDDSPTCTLTGNADKYVLAAFGTAADRTGHPNWNDPAVHGAKYWALVNGTDASALNCMACHGAELKGRGIAVSCQNCHSTGVPNVGGHQDQSLTNPAWQRPGNWNNACVRCHTNGGFNDWTGNDASLADYDDEPYTGAVTTAASWVAEDGPLKCASCHNATAMNLTKIVFPSSKVITTDNATALCGQCHMARESTVSINAKIGSTELDAQIAVASNSFANPHYFGAAATMFGSDVKGWAEYPNLPYTGTNKHAVNEASCVSCHDAHTGTVSVTAQTCGRCHFDETTGQPITTFAQLEEQRQFGFEGDIDGDTVVESLKHEIEGLEETLYVAIQTYTTDIVATDICYNGASHPYYYEDSDADGTCATTTAFKKFTPRLLRAAYNNKFAHAEPGAWAHNPRYAIEILYDAIRDLKAGMVAKRVTAGATATDAQAAVDALVPFAGFRSFNGHFGGARAAAPYRAFVYSAASSYPNWTGFSSGACYQCHGGETGLNEYLAGGPTSWTFSMKKVTGLECTTCHAPQAGDTAFNRIRTIATVSFPPQKNATAPVSPGVVTYAAADLPEGFAICATCHSGRENGQSIVNKIGTTPDDSWTLSFTNPHYLGAAGVLLGTNAKVMYEYPAKTYAGNPVNWGSPYGSPHGASCTGCHDPKGSKHTFEVDMAYCATCHVGGYALAPKEEEVETLKTELYAAIKAYATSQSKTVCYNGASHPYWFADDDSDGTCNTAAGNALLNPKALRAAFNYKWAEAEPGAYAHNLEYMLQVLFDSIEDLGGTPDGLGGLRPASIPRPVTP